MTSFSENLRGAAFMAGSMAAFALNDAIVKAILRDTPLFTTIFWRGLLVIAALVAACLWTGAFRWRPEGRDLRFIVQRGFAELGGTLTFLTALAHMPLASATAILQSTPLVVTLAAALFLSEPVGWRRLLASVIGFLGVLIIVRPGAADFNVYALAALACVGFIAVRDLTTRRLSRGAPTLIVALFTAVLITGLGGIGAVFEAHGVPSTDKALPFAGASLFLILGYVFSVSAMRVGEIAFVAPFRYTILLFATLLGVVFFGEVPDGLTIVGGLVVVATGLFTFWRERQRAAMLARKTLPRGP